MAAAASAVATGSGGNHQTELFALHRNIRAISNRLSLQSGTIYAIPNWSRSANKVKEAFLSCRSYFDAVSEQMQSQFGERPIATGWKRTASIYSGVCDSWPSEARVLEERIREVSALVLATELELHALYIRDYPLRAPVLWDDSSIPDLPIAIEDEAADSAEGFGSDEHEGFMMMALEAAAAAQHQPWVQVAVATQCTTPMLTEDQALDLAVRASTDSNFNPAAYLASLASANSWAAAGADAGVGRPVIPFLSAVSTAAADSGAPAANADLGAAAAADSGAAAAGPDAAATDQPE